MQIQISGDLDGLEEVLAQAGLDGLDAIGRQRFRRIAMQRRQKVGHFTGRHALVLNGLDELSDAELAGIGKKLKKAVKKVAAVAAKVAKVVPVAALMVPSKAGLKNAAKSLAIGGAGAAALIAPGAALSLASTVLGAKKAGGAQPDAAAIDAAAEAQANAIYAQQQSGGGSGGGSGGQVYEGQYLSKDEPDPTPATNGQWIAGIDNNFVLLGTAFGLSGLLFLLVNSRQRKERSHADAA